MTSDDPKPQAISHQFRAKLMDETGRIETTIAILAASKAEALAQVRGLALSYAVELWDGGKLVTTMPLRRN